MLIVNDFNQIELRQSIQLANAKYTIIVVRMLCFESLFMFIVSVHECVLVRKYAQYVNREMSAAS